jgi:hypothetical protein
MFPFIFVHFREVFPYFDRNAHMSKVIISSEGKLENVPGRKEFVLWLLSKREVCPAQ